MDSAAESVPALPDSASQQFASDDDRPNDVAVGDEEDDEDDEKTALLDAAADFIGLVRDNDVDTLRQGIERFGDERARLVCCMIDTQLGGLTAFTLAAELGHADIIALFIQLGADVNGKNATGGWTPLHCAVSQGFIQVTVYQLISWLCNLLTVTAVACLFYCALLLLLLLLFHYFLIVFLILFIYSAIQAASV